MGSSKLHFTVGSVAISMALSSEVQKLWISFKAENSRFIFCVKYLYSNELIGYVDLLDFNKTWLKSLSDTPKYVRLLRKSEYSFCDILLSNCSSQKIPSYSALQGISYATNRNYWSYWKQSVTNRWWVSWKKVIIEGTYMWCQSYRHQWMLPWQGRSTALKSFQPGFGHLQRVPYKCKKPKFDWRIQNIITTSNHMSWSLHSICLPVMLI